MELVLLWWFILFVFGMVTFPISFILLKHLFDKGYAFSKALALLLIGYLSWLLGYISFNSVTILLAVVLVTAFSILVIGKGVGRSFFAYVKKELGFLLLEEVLFLVVFLIAGAYKMRTHDIVGTEKPMDFAFINGILASPSMPPQDPWLSGGSISYYYFGYLIVAVMSRVSQVSSGEAFNLAIAMTWALAALGAFSLVYSLTRRYRYSFLSAAALVFLGNLDFFHRIVQSYQFGDLRIPYYNSPSSGAATGIGAAWDFMISPLQHGWDYFQASRIMAVSNTDKMINEFPSFSFFLSDLHPHVMGIPFVILATALSFNIIKSSASGFGVFGGQRFWQVTQMFLLALVFGGLSFLNSWDFPTLLLLFGICLSFQQWWAGPASFKSWVVSMVSICLPIALGSLILYFPFYLKLQSQAQGMALVGDRTDIYYLFILFGVFFIVVIPVLVKKLSINSDKPVKTGKSKKSEILICILCGKDGTGKNFCGYCGGELAISDMSEIEPVPDKMVKNLLLKIGSIFSNPAKPLYSLIFFVSFLSFLILTNLSPIKMATVLLVLLLIVFGCISLATRKDSIEMVFSTILVLLAFSLILGCELFYVKDMFSGGDLYRMNTVFKFHYQVWILLSIALGPFLKWLMQNQWVNWPLWKRIVWGSMAVIVFCISAMYPLLSFSSRLNGTSPDMATMDGATYYERTYPADYQVAEWIKANIRPLMGKIPVILEAWGGSYHQDFGRIATNTGYPTVLGWDFHEVQWRGSGDKAVIRGQNPDDTVTHRQNDIDAIYTSLDLQLTTNLLKKYGVDYVYVGDSERQKYAANVEALNKFTQLGIVVFQVGNSVLYKINS
jgi:YYY domain-containing protein